MNKILLLSLFSLLVLASCSSPMMTPAEFSVYSKGDLAYNWKESAYEPDFIYEFKNVNNEKDITVYVLKVVHYVRTSQIFFVPVKSSGYSYGIFAYDKNGLIYWGFLDDFMKSDNPLFRKAGELTADQLLKSNEANYLNPNSSNYYLYGGLL